MKPNTQSSINGISPNTEPVSRDYPITLKVDRRIDWMLFSDSSQLDEEKLDYILLDPTSYHC